jgi:hypothetical protein
MNQEQAKTLTDNELSYALQDIRNTTSLHECSTPYYAKLRLDYEVVVEEMGRRCAIEYLRRY